MENVKKFGIFFNEEDIKKIIEKHVEWAEVTENQVFCVEGVMNENTPVGTSVIASVDGVKSEEGSNELKLILYSGTHELCVKTINENDVMNIRFDKTIPVAGTYGVIEDGVIDILTEEEKEFKHFVEEALGEREDEYAEMFRKDNVREIGGRGLILLEKIKAEIKNDDVLSTNDITPIDLTAVFIEKTEAFIQSCENEKELSAKYENVFTQYQETFEEGSKKTKRLAREIEVLRKKIDANRQIGEFCKSIINAAVLPVLNA